jgi:N-acetylglucosaminyldiphosphoundecaprenol N-acetyl-beta-D-mannosaminyltransferase
MKIERVNVLGVGISAVNLTMAMEVIAEAIQNNRRDYVCVTGVHGVMEAREDPHLRQILNRALLCTPDGMPMVWLSWLAGKSQVDRVYGPDLMTALCRLSQARGYRHFLVGGCSGTAAVLQARLEHRFPGIRIVGTYEPPFRPLDAAEEEILTQQVHAAQPDLLWVGLSTPKQEKFMASHHLKFDAKVMIGVGAAFDFLAGRIKQAPHWMQRSGLEWLYRLSREPRRLWRRYLKNNPRFICHVSLQLLGLEKPGFVDAG